VLWAVVAATSTRFRTADQLGEHPSATVRHPTVAEALRRNRIELPGRGSLYGNFQENVDGGLFDRRGWLKFAALLVAINGLDGLGFIGTGMSFMRKDKVTRREEESHGEQVAINRDFVARSPGWVSVGARGIQASELTELGISADQAGFDRPAVCDHFQPW
jgi:hypothetical protein